MRRRPALPWDDDWYRYCEYSVDWATGKWEVADPSFARFHKDTLKWEVLETPSPRPALLAAGGDGGRCAVFALGTRGRRFESHGGRTTNHPHRPMAPSGTDKVEVECDEDDDW